MVFGTHFLHQLIKPHTALLPLLILLHVFGIHQLLLVISLLHLLDFVHSYPVITKRSYCTSTNIKNKVFLKKLFFPFCNKGACFCFFSDMLVNYRQSSYNRFTLDATRKLERYFPSFFLKYITIKVLRLKFVHEEGKLYNSDLFVLVCSNFEFLQIVTNFPCSHRCSMATVYP